MSKTKVDELVKLIAKLHFLDDRELSYVVGTVDAMSFVRKVKQDGQTKEAG